MINTVDNFTGGKLKYFVKNWEKLSSDAFILNAVKGYKIEQDEIPKQNFRPSPIVFNEQENKLITMEVNKFLKKGIVRLVLKREKEEYFSNIFIRPKKDNTIRMILNLKNFIESVSKIHFKMEALVRALTTIQQNDYFASIDLKDSYLSVPVHEQDCKYLKFMWNNIAYQFCVLPQGLIYQQVQEFLQNY